MKKTNNDNKLFLKIFSEIEKCKHLFKTNRHYAADYLHDAYIKVVEKYKNKYKENGKLEAWIRTVSNNHIITMLKQEQKHKHMYINDLARSCTFTYKSNNKDIKIKKAIEYTIDALNSLPVIDYEIIIRKSQNIPNVRIAKELNLNVKTIKKHIEKSHNTMREFVCKKYLEDNNEPFNYYDL